MGDSEEKNTYDNLLKQYEFDGQSYVYKDPKTNVTYKFDQEKNEWVVKETEETKADSSGTNEVKAREGTFGFENDTHTYTDPNDGSVYFWDKEKNAWFPKVLYIFNILIDDSIPVILL